jgi:hypothetical protein
MLRSVGFSYWPETAETFVRDFLANLRKAAVSVPDFRVKPLDMKLYVDGIRSKQ